MMAPKPSDYEAGRREGRTEATLEGIAESVDAIWSRLNKLPCGSHGSWLRFWWISFGAVTSGLIGFDIWIALCVIELMQKKGP